MSRITLRSVTPDDLSLLRRWDEEPHVIASDPNDDWRWEEELARDLPWRQRWIAEVAGRPIGFLEVIDPARDDECYWGDVPEGLRALDIWIGEPDALGKGFGTEMMREALSRCFADPSVRAVILDPIEENTRAHRFYERLGFVEVERRQFGLDRCIVYRLDREGWERARPAEH
jgi:aminoglycoside 6'-N-acetyltransferase